jgi:translin
MQHLEEIADRIHITFEKRTAVRDRILSQARTLTRHCSNAIRATHRSERQEAEKQLTEARQLAEGFRSILNEYPDLFYAGYTQDALKEYAEASIVYSLVEQPLLPSPEEIGVDYAIYLQGLAEAVGELRRRCLDLLINGKPTDAERLLEHMDDIYAILVTMDYPDAITGGLRRLTDLARGITERTRGDMTISLRQEKLENSLRNLENRLDNHQINQFK